MRRINTEAGKRAQAPLSTNCGQTVHTHVPNLDLNAQIIDKARPMAFRKPRKSSSKKVSSRRKGPSSGSGSYGESRGRSMTGERQYGKSGSYGKKTGGAKTDSRFEEKPVRGGRTGSRPSKKKSGPQPIKAKSRGKSWRDSAYKSSIVATATAPVITTAKPTAPEAFAPKTAGTEKLPGTGEAKERLQKVLARCGIASRRKAELLILQGAVTVNGRVITELGTKVDAKNDKIKVEGKLLYTEIEPIYMAFYKPKGVISALSDPEGRKHLGQFLRSVRERVIPIGRMDYNSEGLMLLTNDGAMGEKIMKARGLPRLYMVKIKGHPTERDLDFLKRGIFTAEGVVRVGAMGVEQALKNKSWLRLEVTQGANLDLRELLNHRGLLVDRIVRTAIGHISIKGIEPGEFRFFKRQDFERLVSTDSASA